MNDHSMGMGALECHGSKALRASQQKRRKSKEWARVIGIIMGVLIVMTCISCAASDTQDAQELIGKPDEIRLELNSQNIIIYPSHENFDQIVALTKERLSKDMEALDDDFTRNDCTEGAVIVMEFVFDDIQTKRAFVQEDIQDVAYHQLLFVFGNDFESRIMALDGTEEKATYTAYEPLAGGTERLQDVIEETCDLENIFPNMLS